MEPRGPLSQRQRPGQTDPEIKLQHLAQLEVNGAPQVSCYRGHPDHRPFPLLAPIHARCEG